MKDRHKINYAKTMADLYSLMRTHADITPLAGTTGLLKGWREDCIKLPETILFIKDLPDITAIIKRERFIDFGAAATLNEILALGRKNIPDILYQALSAAANPNIRSLATIGGNIAHAPIKNSSLIPLLALDAKLEIRTAADTFWRSLSLYHSADSAVLRQMPHVILRVRVPAEECSFSYYKRLGPLGYISKDSASFVFLAHKQKNILSDVKLLFGAASLIRSKQFENELDGENLPLDRTAIPSIMDKACRRFAAGSFSSLFQKKCFFNLIEDCLYRLT